VLRADLHTPPQQLLRGQPEHLGEHLLILAVRAVPELAVDEILPRLRGMERHLIRGLAPPRHEQRQVRLP
jgi:hypothetical protein